MYHIDEISKLYIYVFRYNLKVYKMKTYITKNIYY